MASRDQCPRLSLQEIAAELERDGHVTAKGNRYSAAAVRSMLRLKPDAATSRMKEFYQG
jgi:hypothetical protein